jgi:hypothetical protein
MTGNAGAAPMVARGVAAARAETPRAEAARAEAARAEARWQEAKMLALAALATTPPQRQQNLIKRKHDPRKR